MATLANLWQKLDTYHATMSQHWTGFDRAFTGAQQTIKQIGGILALNRGVGPARAATVGRATMPGRRGRPRLPGITKIVNVSTNTGMPRGRRAHRATRTTTQRARIPA
jgi:hypothetical protein